MTRKPHSNSGFSLVELMIAMTIGLMLLAGLTTIFVNSSNASREMQKTSQQIENGRYAIDVISTDLRHAGFYGHLHDMSSITAPAAAPDPCEWADTDELRKAMWYPVQGYRGTIHGSGPASDTAASGLSTACAAILDAANLKKGSDVLVIRRADTNALIPTDVPELDVFYLQASSTQAEIQKGQSVAAVAIGTDHNAKGGISIISLSNLATTPPASPIRKYKVHIYFVAPCSAGKGAGGACDGSAGEDTIPTLKRLELEKSGSIKIVPLVEGIDYLKVEYGVDTAPGALSPVTGYKGDGTVDSFTEAPADWGTVIAAKVYLLARNTEQTTGFTDIKTYKLGSAAADNFTVPAASGANARFKRHVYTAAVQLVNAAGRREIP
jgi:type IV pilus assembly protein PilW